jgi:16S rRNA (adenine1518-N6/adenine1519-N6)-dimethyltransferase
MAREERPPPRVPFARRRFGQNFLVDPGLGSRLVRSAELEPDDAVLEIGPGRGALTDRLLESVPRVAAVEIDRDLAAALRARFHPSKLALFEQDVLSLPFRDVPRALGLPDDRRLVVVGALPYNVSKPIARKLVEERRRIERAVLVFQREVAARLTARHGTKDYGPLTVLVGLAYEVRPLFDLPPRAFRPQPEVVSTATLWSARALSPDDELLEALPACLAAAFARRRQTILRNLREALGGDEDRARALLEGAGIDGALRAEAVPPESLVRLARSWTASR